jgi:hypothetical protein
VKLEAYEAHDKRQSAFLSNVSRADILESVSPNVGCVADIVGRGAASVSTKLGRNALGTRAETPRRATSEATPLSDHLGV